MTQPDNPPLWDANWEPSGKDTLPPIFSSSMSQFYASHDTNPPPERVVAPTPADSNANLALPPNIFHILPLVHDLLERGSSRSEIWSHVKAAINKGLKIMQQRCDGLEWTVEELVHMEEREVERIRKRREVFEKVLMELRMWDGEGMGVERIDALMNVMAEVGVHKPE